MTARSSRDVTARSGAGWSDGGWRDASHHDLARDGGDDGGHPFRVDELGRYDELEVVGRGGMGQVVVARDRRLGRDVALKRIAAPADGPELAARLAREARVTAILEHPSIVPVYDAGVGDDGRLFYTMRLIHGRSLAEAAAECRDADERMRLLRPFLAVCEAVAYAHSRGVVHRDLKPANVMVGGFGETQVVDWGLAAFTALADPALRREAAPIVDTDRSIGTPGYMSPEQTAGLPADPRADVWSLGVILHELVGGDDGTGLPAELAAIAAKATARAPAERYPDAGAMAEEVARFLDGRRVEAHAYTTLELARRLVRRLRVPIALVLTALIVTAIAVTVSFRRITRERERAQVAELGARTALAESRRTSAWALTRQAVAELERGAVAEAGVLAAHALALDESADARGVVAAALVSPHPRHAETIALPGCTNVVPGSWELALCHDSDHVDLWQLAPAERRWRRDHAARLVGLASAPGVPDRVVIVDDDPALVVVRAADGEVVTRHPLAITTGFATHLQLSLDGRYAAVSDGRAVDVVALDGGTVAVHDKLCAGSGVVALAAGGARFAVVCASGVTSLLDETTGAVTPGPTVPGAAALRPIAAALSPDGRALVIGGLSGELVAIDLAAGTVTPPIAAGGGEIMHVAFVPGPRPWILAGTAHAGAAVLDLGTGALVLRLPASASRAVRITREGIVTGGRHCGRWQLDDAPRPRALVAPAGLSSVAVTGDHRWIAAGRGDGHVSVWDGTTGALVHDRAVSAGVVKAVAFSPDGARLAMSTGPDRSPQAIATGTWAPVRLDPGADPARRLAYTAGGELIAARFSPPPARWSADGARRPLDGPQVYDLATTADREVLLMLAVDGGVWRLDGDALHLVTRVPGASTLAVWARGTGIATSHPTSVLVQGGGRPARRLDTAARIFDLAVSPDERYLAAARDDGTVAVWRLTDAQLVAVLRGHTQRVAAVAITAGALVLSASWDGSVLLWDLRALDADPATLIATMEARWGLDLDRTLETADR